MHYSLRIVLMLIDEGPQTNFGVCMYCLKVSVGLVPILLRCRKTSVDQKMEDEQVGQILI